METNRSAGLWTHLSTHVLILDTSFAMQPGFGNFLVDYASIFQQNRILIPRLVIDELQKLMRASDEDRRQSAFTALQHIKGLLHNSMAEVRHEDGDTFVDQVIQRVVEQHMLRKDMLVLTNDAPLMRDIRAKLTKESVRTDKSIRVVKLHRGTNQPVEFHPLPNNGIPQARRGTVARIQPFKKVQEVFQNDDRILTNAEIDSGSALHLHDGSTVTLGSRIAHGGEGAIFEVVGRQEVCKIYRRDKLTRSKEEKIQLMLSRPLSVAGICWPVDIVRDADREFRGYTMPRARGRPLGHTLFLPKQFLAANPTWTRRDSVQLVLSLLHLISILHEMNVLIGDINPQNLLFTDVRDVSIVDCDSFQIEAFPCPVGTINFSAPEIQGKDFRTFLRTEEHELFAIATLLFMIMFPGKSPYSHAGGEDGAGNIRKMEFPYTRDRNSSTHRAPSGVWTCCWSHLSMPLKDAFSHSFSRTSYGQPRVTVGDWIRLFRGYAKILSDDSRVFMGPRPQVGYDLSIMPHSRRYTEDQRDKLPRDGKSDYERLLQAMVKSAQATPTLQQPQPVPTAYLRPSGSIPSPRAQPSSSLVAPAAPTRHIASSPATVKSSATRPVVPHATAPPSNAQSGGGCLTIVVVVGSALTMFIVGMMSLVPIGR
jgi:rRNA-processing protein FCF1/serine/threonine protein kinase